jgi:hypothetical protein
MKKFISYNLHRSFPENVVFFGIEHILEMAGNKNYMLTLERITQFSLWINNKIYINFHAKRANF